MGVALKVHGTIQIRMGRLYLRAINKMREVKKYL
jgi:hypothetical protein